MKEEPDTGVILLGGGHICAADAEELAGATLPIYCADSGYKYAREHGLNVAGVIGDLDSVDRQDCDAPMHFMDDQNTTDFDKSLGFLKARYILCYGFQGGRLDHSLAALNSLAKHKAANAYMITEEDVCCLCPDTLSLDISKPARFSVFPMTECKAHSVGLEYPLDGVDLSPIGRIGTSNRAVGGCLEIQIETGVMLAVFERVILSAVLEQLY